MGWLLAPLILAGCQNTLPIAGPRMDDVMNGASQQVVPASSAEAPATYSYPLVTLSPEVIGVLESEERPQRFAGDTIAAPAQEIRLGVGDVVSVTIFERQTGGLFIPLEAGSRPGNFVQLPAQQVDRSGAINVPFAGSVRAVNRTPAQLERAIAAALAQRALDPQVVVSLVDRRSSGVSVVGDVGQSLRFSLDPNGERVLGGIARAGGTRFAPHETLVTLQRAGRVEQALLSDIVADPALNVPLAGGDTLVVSRQQRFFLALGAVGQSASITQLNRRFPFEERNLSMADAIARAGGLQDDRANPRAVFLFRFERRRSLGRLGVPAEGAAETMPVVYRADLINPSSMFLMQRFPMRDGDLIFVSNAPATDLLKLFQLITPFAQSGANFRAFSP